MEWTIKERSKILLGSYAGEIDDKDVVLDVGCGNGVMSKIIKDKTGSMLIGTDIEDYRLVDILFQTMGANITLNTSGGIFDVTMLNGVLHHIPYNDQVHIIRECMRVSKKCLVFDDTPTLRSKYICWLLNKIHNPRMPITHSFRTKINWQNLIENMGFKFIWLPVSKPWYYPLDHLAFKIEAL